MPLSVLYILSEGESCVLCQALSPVQPWMSPWAEAVGLFSLWKRSWSGTNHTFFHQGYRDPGASNAGGAQGKGKRPQMLAAARKFSPKLKKTHFFPLQRGKKLQRESVCFGTDSRSPSLEIFKSQLGKVQNSLTWFWVCPAMTAGRRGAQMASSVLGGFLGSVGISHPTYTIV